MADRNYTPFLENPGAGTRYKQNPTTADIAKGYPTFDSLKQLYVNSVSGQPFTGAIPGTSNFAINGNFSTTAPPNMAGATQPPAPQFEVIKTVKQPEIAGATTGLLQQQQSQSDALTKSFQDYLNEAKAINQQSKTQLEKDRAAFDTGRIETELPQINRDYEAAQRGVETRLATSNRDYAGETKAIIDKLNAENKTYETNAQAVADRAVNLAMKRNSLYQLGSGTPTSGSGYLTNRYIDAYNSINVPLQRELSERRYGQTVNIERPIARELYQNDQGLMQWQSALEREFAGNKSGIAKYLQDLRMRVSGMSRAQAESYLASVANQLGVSQRLLAGEISNLSGLQRLDALANEYTFNKLYDDSRLPQTPVYQVTSPERNYTPRGGQVTQTPSFERSTFVGDRVNQPGTAEWFEANTARRLAKEQMPWALPRERDYGVYGLDENKFPVSYNPELVQTGW